MIPEFLAAYVDHCQARRDGTFTDFDKVQAFGRAFATPDGQTVLLELMRMANVLRPVVVGDDATRAMAEGQRALVHDILRYSTADVDPNTKTVNYRIE